MLFPVSVCKYTKKGEVLLSVCDYKSFFSRPANHRYTDPKEGVTSDKER